MAKARSTLDPKGLPAVYPVGARDNNSITYITLAADKALRRMVLYMYVTLEPVCICC